MSRRGAMIEEVDDEEEFDDDTDLPLLHLPNTGARGPLLQQVTDTSSAQASPPPQSRGETSLSSRTTQEGETSASGETVTVDPVTGRRTVWVQDGSAYKMWTSLYPVYFDAKRAYGRSERRIEREKSLWWPLSSDIVDACTQLGLRTLHEPSKRHPRDWENPGRVKVSFKIDGRLQDPMIRTKKQLLETIARKMQQAHPSLVPGSEAADPTGDIVKPTHTPQPMPEATVKSSSGKKEKAKPESQVRTASAPRRTRKCQLPQPPAGLRRVSQYSPAQEANLLIETVKAGMNAPAPGEGPSAAAMGGKGKRKVVRVRA